MHFAAFAVHWSICCHNGLQKKCEENNTEKDQVLLLFRTGIFTYPYDRKQTSDSPHIHQVVIFHVDSVRQPFIPSDLHNLRSPCPGLHIIETVLLAPFTVRKYLVLESTQWHKQHLDFINIVSLPIVLAIQNSPQSLDKIFFQFCYYLPMNRRNAVIFLTLIFITFLNQK